MTAALFWKAAAESVLVWKTALPAMFFGCWCGIVLRKGMVLKFFSALMRPLTWLGRVPKELGAFFILCLLNRYAANAMLAELEQNGFLKRRVLLALYLMGALPTGIYYTAFYFSPILLTALGQDVGGTFIGIHIVLSLLVTAVGFSIQWFWPQECGAILFAERKAQPDASEKKAWGDLKAAWRQFGEIAAVFVPITFLFTLLMQMPFLSEFALLLDGVLRGVSLSAAGVMVILAGIPTLIAGIALAGSLLASGALSASEVILSLLLASFCHNVYDGLSRVLPSNISIFGFSLGLRVTILGTGLYLLMITVMSVVVYNLG